MVKEEFSANMKVAMSRIFLSHASADERQAKALKQWLTEQDPPLANEIFLDLDHQTGIKAGQHWKEALRKAGTRCEAVICLISHSWSDSLECRVEYRTAENLSKQIFCALLEESARSSTAVDLTRDWQHVLLFPDSGTVPTTSIDIDDGSNQIVFPTDGLIRLRDAIRGAGIGAESFVWPPPRDEHRSPYRGWEPLEEVDAAVFFGRDEEISKGLDALRDMRIQGLATLFVVLGPSGTGKSSFLRAGLLPRLRRDDRHYFILDPMRPRRNALTGEDGFAKSLAATRVRFELPEGPLGDIKRACTAGDWHRIAQWIEEVQHAAAQRCLADSDGASDSPPVALLPLDQAEELFNSDAGPEAGRFLDMIAHLASHPTLGLIVCATIRTDRYTALQTAPQLAGVSSQLFDELRPMSESHFSEVITKPAKRSTEGGRQLTIDPALVNNLAEEASSGADTLPLLALAMARLYEDYASTGTITVDHYANVGRMAKIVQAAVDEVLSGDPAEREEQLRVLRSAFIPWLAGVDSESERPYRRTAKTSELPTASRPLIDALVSKRLLVKDELGGDTIVEVGLESLLHHWDDLRRWLDEENQRLKESDALVRTAHGWHTHRENESWLLSGSRLVEAEQLLEDPTFHDSLSEIEPFVEASRARENQRLEAERLALEERVEVAERLAKTEVEARKEAEAHSRTLRKRSRILALVLTVAIVLGLMALSYYRSADRQATLATAAVVVDRAQTEQIVGRQSTLQYLAASKLRGDEADETRLNLAGVDASLGSAQKIVDIPGTSVKTAFTDNGPVAVSLTPAGIRRWSLSTGAPIGDPIPTTPPENVALSPNGELIAARFLTTIDIIDFASGRRLRTLESRDGFNGAVAFSPDAQTIVAALNGQLTEAWRTRSGDRLWMRGGHISDVFTIAFSATGDKIATTGYDDRIVMWDTATGHQDYSFPTSHQDLIRGLAFSPRGDMIASGANDYKIKLWRLEPRGQARFISELDGNTGTVLALAFTHDGSTIVSGASDQTIRLWDATTGAQTGQPLIAHSMPVVDLRFSSSGQDMESMSTDGTVRLWNTNQLIPDTGHESAVYAIAFEQDGSLITAGQNGTVRRRFPHDIGIIPTPTKQFLPSQSATISSKGAIISFGDLPPALFPPGETTPKILTPGEADVSAAVFSPDGSYLATGTVDGVISVWNVPRGDLYKTFSGPAHRAHKITALAFSPDGHTVASAEFGNDVWFWNLKNDTDGGRPLVAQRDTIRTLAFSPDLKTFATGSADNTIELWDLSAHSKTHTLKGHTGQVNDVRFSRDGKLLASSSIDRTIRLWDVMTGRDLGKPLAGSTDSVLKIAFSPDGKLLASAGRDGTVRLWHVPTADPQTAICTKLAYDISPQEWQDWVSANIDPRQVCPNLPQPPS
ncbi:TIR domain-containing protein [Smaragdicoccus niigatensis]|uniref:nSTAND1 domain-containing NTPase n=1 Tax=Smaragdicoccus niigatensis TaxID=359359 RepID=UPI000381EFE8|nr:TIR domain-containing protein [Smaragdicoccus niigatensis]